MRSDILWVVALNKVRESRVELSVMLCDALCYSVKIYAIAQKAQVTQRHAEKTQSYTEKTRRGFIDYIKP
jgi:hypothetical protein